MVDASWDGAFTLSDGALGVNWSTLKVLAALVEPVLRHQWRAIDLDFSPSPAASRASTELTCEVSGLELISAFALDPQLIDGELIGRDKEGSSRMQIAVIDAAHWDIRVSSAQISALVRDRLPGISPLPGW